MHVVGYASSQPTWWLRSVSAWCVPGFILITGWFGTEFSWKKILRLFGVQFYCVLAIQGLLFYQQGRIDPVAAIKQFRGSWFLNGYTLLLCFVPALNHILEKGTVRVLLPIFVVVFGWGFAMTIPVLGRIIPQADGVGPYSLV